MAAPTAFSCRSFADSVGFDVSMHVGCLQNRSCTMLVKNQSLPGPRFCLRELRGTWTAAFVFFYLVRSISEGATSAAHVTTTLLCQLCGATSGLTTRWFLLLQSLCVLKPVASCVDVVEQFAWGLEVVMWYSSSNSARIVHLNSCRISVADTFLDLALKAPWGPLSMTTSAPHVRHHFCSTRRHFGGLCRLSSSEETTVASSWFRLMKSEDVFSCPAFIELECVILLQALCPWGARPAVEAVPCK